MGRSYEHKKVQKKAKELEGPVCNICGDDSEPHTHHLVEVHQDGAADDFNTIIMCAQCHRDWHNGGLEGVNISRNREFCLPLKSRCDCNWYFN